RASLIIMNRKIQILGLFVTIFVLNVGLSEADTSINTDIRIENGNTSLSHTTNNKTLNITVNGTGETEIQTNATEDNISYSINSSGSGQAKVESDGNNYQVNSTVDSKKDNFSGKGSFERIFSFFDSLFISGLVRTLSI
ncbi:MAG: hypothetical protein ABEK17_03710, partial [Candidatus Aenigmatarchaeota archaeon]